MERQKQAVEETRKNTHRYIKINIVFQARGTGCYREERRRQGAKPMVLPCPEKGSHRDKETCNHEKEQPEKEKRKKKAIVQKSMAMTGTEKRPGKA